MSAGHRHSHKLTEAELDDLLDEVLANAKIKKRLARGFSLDTSYDIALLGSSSVGGRTVYLDRHLRYKNWPYGVIPVRFARLDVKPGLIRHERLEQALEDELGWHYDRLAHPVAQHYEERLYKAKGFDPRAVEKAFSTYIKADEHERIVKSPTDLDMRPLLAPPPDTEIIKRVRETANKEKRPHESVGYVEKSVRGGQQCSKCVMFVDPKYGGEPGCTLVRDEIVPAGWCRRFSRGVLGEIVEHEHQHSERKSSIG